MAELIDEEEAKKMVAYSKIFVPPNPFVQRMKRHQDAVMALYSPDSLQGSILFSASADE